jgi:uncharacterized membrane protein YidH (DUF202 family)
LERANLRMALTALSVGFALEGIAELYTLLTPGSTHVSIELLFLLPALFAIIGLVLMRAGRKEWVATQAVGGRAASAVFAASTLSGVAGVGVVALLLYDTALGIPWWAPVVFGGGLAAFVWGTTVTYACLMSGLLSRASRALVVVALAWALIVSGLAGAELASNLGSVLAIISQHAFVIPPFVAALDATLCWLFLTFFVLLAASIDAHVSVARGRAPASGRQSTASQRVGTG